jgi:alanine racemase
VAVIGTFAQRVEAARQGTHALVDLDAFAGNVRALRAGLRDREPCELMAVVKANAYGHGIVTCARAALEAGADRLGVARIEEGLLLRAHGVDAPILALGPFNASLAGQAAEQGIAVAVGSTGGLGRLLPALAGAANRLEVHLKVDSGMHRYGVEPKEVVSVAKALAEADGVELAGLFSHFATADESDPAFMREQERRFSVARAELESAGLLPRLIHQTNSAGTIRGVKTARPELASGVAIYRVGLALYGLSPSTDVPAPPGVRPVLTLRTRLGRVFTLEPGEGVSYGLTHVARRPTRCGTVPVGYGDGLFRLLSNVGWMAVGGARCPILGRVCMDQTVIDLSDAPAAAEGGEVTVLGDGSDAGMTADDMAAVVGTINYEIVTALAARVPRVYLRHGEPVAVSDLFGLVEAG